MTRLDLIFSLVCENDTTFQNISKADTAKLLLTSKIAQENANVAQMAAKYKAQDLFNKLNRNIISLAFANLKKREEDIIQYFSKEQRLMDTLFKSKDKTVIDNFLMKFISEYKQYMYDSIYNTYYFEDVEQAIFEEYQRIVEAYSLDNDVYYHEYDPAHIMFNEKDYYEFYENVEKHGDYILDIWMNYSPDDTDV